MSLSFRLLSGIILVSHKNHSGSAHSARLQNAALNGVLEQGTVSLPAAVIAARRVELHQQQHNFPVEFIK